MVKDHYDFVKLFDEYITSTLKGHRTQKGGRVVRRSSVEPYFWVRKLLYDFSVEKKFPLRIRSLDKMKKREISAERKYWKEFYRRFTNYMYDDLDCYDNYVAGCVKRLRSFFNYLNSEKQLNVGEFYKSFYVQQEEIDIVVLVPEQLEYLINDEEFVKRLPVHLQATRDLFVFGCTVALRISDLLKITMDNIQVIGNRYYLSIQSQKTTVHTRVLLPEYLIRIIKGRDQRRKLLFKPISKARLNKNIKSMLSYTSWTEPRIKTRKKRGIPVIVYKNKKTKESFRFNELITTHTMRRTAITTMLCAGMMETAVRKISGHAANSKEFFRYVALSQSYMDQETEKLHLLFKPKSDKIVRS